MSCYSVDFGEYKILCDTRCKHFNYFKFCGQKYLIGSPVKLNDRGMQKMFYNGKYYYTKGDFRLVDYSISEKGASRWTYIIGWDRWHDPVFYYTSEPPEEFVKSVVWQPIQEEVFKPGELDVEFKEEKQVNVVPSDWDVPEVIIGWIVFIVIFVAELAFKDWWIRFIVQIVSGWTFGAWRERKINEAIVKQNSKK